MTPEGVGGVEEWKQRVTQDISDLKQSHSYIASEQTKQKDDIRDLRYNDRIQAQEIRDLKEDLTEIKSDTTWIRRRITGAIITATITAIVGGVIALAISNIF